MDGKKIPAACDLCCAANVPMTAHGADCVVCGMSIVYSSPATGLGTARVVMRCSAVMPVASFVARAPAPARTVKPTSRQDIAIMHKLGYCACPQDSQALS